MKKNKIQMKLIKACSIFLLAGTLISITPCTTAHAQTGPTGTSSKYLKVQPITVKFSASECSKIAKNYKTTSKVATISAALTAKSVGAVLIAYGYSMSEMGDKFQKAADKGKGIKITYDYYISNTSYSLNEYKNVKVSYY